MAGPSPRLPYDMALYSLFPDYRPMPNDSGPPVDLDLELSEENLPSGSSIDSESTMETQTLPSPHASEDLSTINSPRDATDAGLDLPACDGRDRDRGNTNESPSAGRLFFCDRPHCKHPRGFKRKYDLDRHIDSKHEKKNSFKCDVCGKRCSRPDNLRVHQRIHQPKQKDGTFNSR